MRDVKTKIEGCTFVWDAQKMDSNLKKHGVRFAEALEVLFDPNYQAKTLVWRKRPDMR